MRRITLSPGVRAARISRAHSIRPCLEILEDRLLPAVAPTSGVVSMAVPGVSLISFSAISPNGGPGQPGGFSPQQISQAYGFNQIRFDNGAIQGDGSGQTIAIVDAYNQPNIASDLQTFDSTYGLAAPHSFAVVNENGGSSLPAADQSWGLEISLDVEWAHAMAPEANILLVEANSPSYSDLMRAVNFARNQPGVSVVSLSWGSGEWSGESAYDGYFTTPAGHQGITFVASSGDTGTVEYPSTSPNVLAVGGTQLSTDASGDYLSESTWSGSGGGISTAESQPSYQQGVVTQTSSYRAVPDVAYNGSSNSPFAIYDTSSYGGWLQVYGTSAGAPQWAALIAIANQGRALNGQGSLDGGSQTLPTLYQLPQSDFHDITSGSNGTYSAGPGYDLVTGRGSPVANLIVAGLVGQNSSATPPWVAQSASASSGIVNGTTTNLSVLGGDNYNPGALTYTWSVVSEPGGAAGPDFSANGSNAAQNTTVIFHSAGTYTFQVTITNIYGLSATSDVNVTVNQTVSSLSLTPTSGSVYNNGTLTFTATALDQFGHAMNTQPGWSWSLAGAGSLNGNGQYTAPGGGSGTVTIDVSGDGLVQTATVTFNAAPGSSFPNPGQTWSPWQQFLDTWMSQLSQLQSLWQFLLASWSIPGIRL
jgi:subtilase family serine protease